MNVKSIYLASQSPRRRELLDQIGVAYEVLKVDVVEERQYDETPAEYVQRLAYDKAFAGSRLQSDKPVLGADTIVVLHGKVLEKPFSQQEAVDMLLMLSSQTHQVMTAVSLVANGDVQTVLTTTEVSFRGISRTEAEQYWHTGEPQDKAGGYGIQGIGAIFVERINGSYSAVVGLPLLEVSRLLMKVGIRLL